MLNDARPMRRFALVLIAGASALALAGCESSRFGGLGGASAPRPRVAEAPPPEPIAPSVPSGSVTAEPLAPPSGGGSSEPPPRPIASLGGGGGGGAETPPSSRSTATGAWNAREASGSCKINLSSTPSLDLYRASAGGCANKELSRVTSWDFRDGEVYLFQPGGAVAARLRPGGGGLSGVLSKSGAPLTLTRS